MVDSDPEIQSRAKFLSYWGPSRIAEELHLTSHSTVSNWSRNGFAHHAKGPLIALALRDGRDPHPDLFSEQKGYRHHPPTPLTSFIKRISKAYGSHHKFSLATGIPFASIRSMCQRQKSIMQKHVPAIEAAAVEKGIELPEFWREVREAHRIWEIKRQDRSGIDRDVADDVQS